MAQNNANNATNADLNQDDNDKYGNENPPLFEDVPQPRDFHTNAYH